MVQRQPGRENLQHGDEKHRGEAGRQRKLRLLNGDGRQIGQKNGGDQLGGLKFAQLAFAHQAHGENQGQIHNQGAQSESQHDGDPLSGKFTASCFENHNKRMKRSVEGHTAAVR